MRASDSDVRSNGRTPTQRAGSGAAQRAHASTSAPKTYDRRYFDRWYRVSRHAIFHAGMLPRRVQLAVSAAEYLLERPIRSVLDIGCGEGRWRPLLLRARPRLHYQGIDSSEYAVRRFGRRRNIRFGRFGDIGRMGLRRSFDLIVCADVLHYVPRAEARAGLRGIARLLGGVAFIELFTSEDDSLGDDAGFMQRSRASYLRMFRAAGLIPMGLHCYTGRALRDRLVSLERQVR
jgi:SAM-dependent methyltransferase